MRSVADDLRAESRRRLATLTPAERIHLSLRLGDADLALMCAARSITREHAKRIVAGSRQAGRVYSRSARQ